MTSADRDLALALRAELAAIDPSRPCDRHAEAAALAGVATARDGPMARLLLRFARERAADAAAEGAADAAADTGAGASLTAASRAARSRGVLRPFDWAASAEHCRLPWLRGLFLARGSLSLAGGRTHLEFVVGADDAPVLAVRLADAGLPASWRIRRGRGVVTSKSGERVGLLLRRIGAAATVLELEARQVSRALRGDLN